MKLIVICNFIKLNILRCCSVEKMQRMALALKLSSWFGVEIFGHIFDVVFADHLVFHKK